MLLQWQPPKDCLVAGDFNARHYSWQTGRPSGTGQAGHCKLGNGQWPQLAERGGHPDQPIRQHHRLGFHQRPLAEACVEDDFATTSDHFTLSLTLSNFSPVLKQSGKVRLTTDDE
ncbi:hypothetical protein E5D57_013414 [Metarhizium anisopliae]|nr:hypothetical protein E5D57_013414 [Metarhizium anisopliae]